MSSRATKARLHAGCLVGNWHLQCRRAQAAQHAARRGVQAIRYAVCAIIEKDDKLLVISRRDDFENWNLPGGKVEDAEEFETALCREVFEETGLKVGRAQMVFAAVCKGDKDYFCMTYKVLDFTGDLVSSDEGAVRWGTWDDILTPLCSFQEYNRKLYHAYVEGQEDQTD